VRARKQKVQRNAISTLFTKARQLQGAKSNCFELLTALRTFRFEADSEAVRTSQGPQGLVELCLHIHRHTMSVYEALSLSLSPDVSCCFIGRQSVGAGD
jgi:hypothetical protein